VRARKPPPPAGGALCGAGVLWVGRCWRAGPVAARDSLPSLRRRARQGRAGATAVSEGVARGATRPIGVYGVGGLGACSVFLSLLAGGFVVPVAGRVWRRFARPRLASPRLRLFFRGATARGPVGRFACGAARGGLANHRHPPEGRSEKLCPTTAWPWPSLVREHLRPRACAGCGLSRLSGGGRAVRR
jgi:hypothetical protein